MRVRKQQPTGSDVHVPSTEWRTRKASTQVQTLIFSKDRFTREQAVQWAKDHDFQHTGVDETGESYRIRQENPGEFKTMRTIEMKPGVKAVIGKSSVNELLRPENAYNSHIPEQGIVGGTVKAGSDDEKFLFGRMMFDIQRARDLGGNTPNAEVPVSDKWIEKTKVFPDKAMKGQSTNPVFIAQIHTHDGIKPLLIDGNHRMYKAVQEGVMFLPAHVFSPEESVELMTSSKTGSTDDLAPVSPGGLRGAIDKIIKQYVAKALGVHKEADVEPPISNLDQGQRVNEVRKDPAPKLVGGMADNRIDGIYSMQQVVMGMDYELANNAGIDEDQAREMAVDNLSKDPDYYRKKDAYSGWTSDPLMKDTQEGEEDAVSGTGLAIDLGSGQAREPGHLGFDLYPYDYGTVVHDLNLGIPLPDGCVSKCVMKDALEYMDMTDPKPLLSEIQRVLMPGGQFDYQGPNQLQNAPEYLKPHPASDVKVSKVEGVRGKPVQQRFTRIAVPDAATADDAEPRIGIAQFDMLPADALLAMDALGYYWSDATSSGRGNRASGYPSQGALVNKPTQKSREPLDLQIAKAALVHKDELSTEGREHVKSFALPAEGKYPIHDLAHARNALARASGKPEEAKVRAAVYRKWPSLKPEPAKKRVKKGFYPGKRVSIFKLAPMKQVVYGVILTPDEVDLQDDFMRSEDIEKAAHAYMVNSRTVGKMHTSPIKADVVESYIAPMDMKYDGGQYGPQVVKKGSWVLGVRVNDPKEWEKVVNGEYKGFSVGGAGIRDQA